MRTKHEIEEPLRRVGGMVRARIRRTAALLGDDRWTAVLRYLEIYLFDPSLTVEKIANSRIVIAAGGIPPTAKEDLGVSLRRYYTQQRLEVVAPLIGSCPVPTGQIATAVGFASYYTFREVYIKHFGKPPPTVRATKRIAPRFDEVTWSRAIRGYLTEPELIRLMHELREVTPKSREEQKAKPPDDEPRNITKIRHEFIPVVLRNKPKAWHRAIEPVLERVAADCEYLPPHIARVLRRVGASICDSELRLLDICKAEGVGDNSVTTQFVFYLGDTFIAYLEKLRVELVIRLFMHCTITSKTAAEAAGMSQTSLARAFKVRAGMTPRYFMRIPPKNKIELSTWLRAGRGKVSPNELALLLEDLRVLYPGVVLDLNVPFLPSIFRADPASLIQDEGSMPQLHKLQKLVEEACRGKPKRVKEKVEIEEDWGAFERVARLLSKEREDSESRRDIEALLITSEKDARILYLVREIQCMVTTADAIEKGETPEHEFWAPWLRVRALGEDRAELTEWAKVENRLVDAPEALKRWRAADEVRCRMMKLTEKKRREELGKTDSEVRSYLVARACLFAEQHFHRGRLALSYTETHLAMMITIALYRDEVRALKRTAGTDLLALSWARVGNVHRQSGAIRRADSAISNALTLRESGLVGEYVESEILSLHASILKDEAKDFDLAERQADAAIALFESFDSHQAGCVLVNKADIQRLRGNQIYLATFDAARKRLQRRRDVSLVEVVQNNFLFYLVREKKFAEAEAMHRTTPWPLSGLRQAERACTAGCIEIACGSPEIALHFLNSARDAWVDLGRIADVMIALLYLAALKYRKGMAVEGRDDLVQAAYVAGACGFGEESAIREILTSTNSAGSISDEILKITFGVGGCLGPLQGRDSSRD